jgi:hypothetical protein
MLTSAGDFKASRFHNNILNILERFSKRFFPYFLFWAKQSGKYLMLKIIKENRILVTLSYFHFLVWCSRALQETYDIPLGTECLKLSGIFFFDTVDMILNSKAFHWKTSWIKWNENMKYNKVISHIIQKDIKKSYQFQYWKLLKKSAIHKVNFQVFQWEFGFGHQIKINFAMWYF